MQDKLFNIKKVLAMIVFIAVFSLMGLSTGKPIMVLAYAVFFVLVSFGVIITIRKKQRHFEVSGNTNPMLKKIGGIVLLALALISPLYVFSTSNLLNTGKDVNAVFLFTVFGISVLFLGLMFVAVKLINKINATNLNRALGYVLIIVASIIPGAIVASIDRSTTGIGSTYYIALAVVILAWNGFGLISNQE
ncbi:MAG: hypothetical protein CVU48_04645 [Candidatus Cloacimonetes bacterium HGW-Cloacimonetes-1]|jgi:hypothetical protein|nr:MAG: hypothetical protein CVU48_04645 [Candidatus Cloacimonetes bacterium HGW-Cloacimonetes-1]